MRREEERVNAYLDTVKRLEPDISPIDASAFYASAAISLKRIADQMTPQYPDTIQLNVYGKTHTLHRMTEPHSRKVYRSISLMDVDVVLP